MGGCTCSSAFAAVVAFAGLVPSAPGTAATISADGSAAGSAFLSVSASLIPASLTAACADTDSAGVFVLTILSYCTRSSLFFLKNSACFFSVSVSSNDRNIILNISWSSGVKVPPLSRLYFSPPPPLEEDWTCPSLPVNVLYLLSFIFAAFNAFLICSGLNFACNAS